MNGATPSLVAGAAATGSLAAIESATGICVPLFVWGVVGGLWAFWYLAPMRFIQRAMSLAIAALVASVLANPVALVFVALSAHCFSWWPLAVNAQLVAIPMALAIGLLCHTVIGKKLIDIARRTADGVWK